MKIIDIDTAMASMANILNDTHIFKFILSYFHGAFSFEILERGNDGAFHQIESEDPTFSTNRGKYKTQKDPISGKFGTKIVEAAEDTLAGMGFNIKEMKQGITYKGPRRGNCTHFIFTTTKA